jgi:hypothetical protein
MPAITLEQIQRMQQEEESRQIQSDLLPYFLSLFDEGKPLQKETFDEWRLQNMIPLRRIVFAANEAVEKGFIVQQPDGLYITQAGREHAAA